MSCRIASLILGLGIVLLAPMLGAQTVVVGDTLTVHIRIVPSIRDSVVVRDSLVIRDSVVIHYDTIPVYVPGEPPVEPEPALDSIVAWHPIVDPPDRERTMQVGDTVRLTVVGANVTAVTPDGRRITRAATLNEIRSAGFSWIHSGVGARRDEALDGTAVTFVSTGLYGSRITHLTLIRPGASNLWRTVITNIPREGEPEPQPEPEPDPNIPLLEWCAENYYGKGIFDGTVETVRPCSFDDTPSYPAMRLIGGISAAFDGDTIRIQQSPEGNPRVYLIPPDVPAVTSGDPATARVYPAEPPYGSGG